jgi:hypothetical protein
MDQRDVVTLSLAGGPCLHHPGTRPTGRCPVQPSTPLGPDQVNVLLLLLATHGKQQKDPAAFNPVNSSNIREIIVLIYLLGVAPAGYLAAPGNGPWAGYRGGADKYRPASDG